ncbi:MAG: hypothetical protein N3A65_01515 [candidate division WOR-3 bacterium]|nr:hypothetical protein [candidate division WOR-3 bacterium]
MRLKLFLTIFASVLIAQYCLSYPWPVAEFPGPHPINATFGEFREPYGGLDYHFHYGVDIGRGAGTQVYPVADGKVSRWSNVENGWIEVGNFRYVHINPNDLILDTARQCTASVTLLGVIGAIEQPHLHFEDGIGIPNKLNPLRRGGFDNYADTAITTVWGSPDFMFFRQGTNTQIYSPLWGRADILVRAKDAQSYGSATTGIYRIRYLIKDRQGQITYQPVENIRFDNVIGYVLYVYDKSRSTNRIYYHWVTNSLGEQNYDRWWNTKLREGQPWDGLNARINPEAEFPDGDYRVWVMAYDIKDNGGDTINRRCAEDEDVMIDNFRPYVQGVRIGQEVVKYQAYWPTEPASDYDLGELVIDKNDYCKAGKYLQFLIEFSEDMRTDVLPALRVQFPDGGVKTVPAGQWIGNRVYRAVTADDFIPAGTRGRATLMISGALDLAGNQNDGNPRTIAYRDAGGEWRQAESPPDANYQFWIEPPPQVIFTDPGDGEEGVDVFDFRKKKPKEIGDEYNFEVVFNKAMDTVSVIQALEVINVDDDSSEVEIKSVFWVDDRTILVHCYDSATFTLCEIKIKEKKEG